MAGSDLCQRRVRRPRRRRHLLVPLVAPEPLGVLDLDHHRRSERAAMAYSTDDRELVLLEFLAGAASVAEAPARHLGLDLIDGDLQTGRQSFDDGHQGLAVGLTCGQEAEHSGEAIRGVAERPWRSDRRRVGDGSGCPETLTCRSAAPPPRRHPRSAKSSQRSWVAATLGFGSGARSCCSHAPREPDGQSPPSPGCHGTGLATSPTTCERAFRRRSHEGRIRIVARPEFLLQHGLMDEHAESVDGVRSR